MGETVSERLLKYVADAFVATPDMASPDRFEAFREIKEILSSASIPSAIRSIEVAGVEIKTVTVPLETAKLVRRVCLPHNPNKCRGWDPDALSAVRTFIAAVEAADVK